MGLFVGGAVAAAIGDDGLEGGKVSSMTGFELCCHNFCF
jgi:hypothetical protein